MADHTPQLPLFTTAPHDPKLEIPFGYCQCGCGQKTTIAKETDKRKGQTKGVPMRFVSGHNGRKYFPPPEIKYCECGCGELAPISPDSDPARGYVRGQPMRYIVGHQNRVRDYPSTEERFWQYVDKRGPDDCWEWIGYCQEWGYGRMMIDKSSRGAHQVSWELHHGSIPEGMFVCHSCDNPPCVNPKHLWLGTNNDNVQDMVAKGRQKGSRFTESDILQIRQLHSDGVSQNQIAKQFDTSRSTVHAIVKRKIWKHI